MILKLSIFGLVLVLIAVIAIQYYRGKEAFQNAKHKRASNELVACAGVSDDTPAKNIPLACAQQLWLSSGCTTKGTDYPDRLDSSFYKGIEGDTFGGLKKAMMGVKMINKTKDPLGEDPEYKRSCFGTMGSSDSSDACAGIPDDTLIENVPLKCAQQLWLGAGCSKNGTEYPLNLNSKYYTQTKGETLAEIKKAMVGVKMINKTKHPLGEDPEYKIGCFGSSSSDSSDACSGIPDNTPSEEIPINCIQSQWTKLGCKKDAIGYPIDSDNVISHATKGMDFGTMKKAVDLFIQDNLFSTDDNLRLLCNSTINDIASGNQSAAAPNRSAAAPQRKDIQPQISVSDTSYMAMKGQQKSDLLSSIQKIVRNELLANRVTQPTMRNLQDNDDCDTNTVDDSHCTAQGSEFKKATPKNMSKGCPDSSDPCDISDQPQNSVPKPYKSNMPDMSKYIKKDSIPCWGCSLDY